MKLLVTSQYYADNRIELNTLVKDPNDIIVINTDNFSAPYLIPDYILVLNEKLKDQLKNLYYITDLIQNLNNKQPLEVKHKGDKNI